MLKTTIKYFVFPAIALLLAMKITSWITGQPFIPTAKAPQQQQADTQKTEAAIGGPFTLTDQHGKTVSSTDFKGKFMLIYFGFTNCPNICPVDMANLSGAMKLLTPEQQAEIQPIFITVDPERDTAAELTSFLANFYSGFEGLTGEKATIDKVVAEYRVYAKKVTDKTSTDGYTVDHSGYSYLMGKDGQFLTIFHHGDTPEAIAEGLRKYL